MASDQTLRAIITVLDRTSEPLRQINARFAALSSPIRHIGSEIGELGELTGIRNIGEHAGEAFEKVRHLGEGLLELAGPLAALSAAGSAAGLVEIAKSTAEFAEQLDISSAKTGIATEDLAGWHYAAGLVNVDVDRLDKGFTFLNRNINEAASGKAKDVEQILNRMGLTNTPQHLAGTSEALKAIAEETKHLVDTGQIQVATDMLAKLFGARQGAELLPLFEQGGAGIAEALAAAKEAGISLTSAQTAAGHQFMEQFKGMQASIEGLKIAIGDELFPVLTPVIEGMREWLNTNREWVATKIGEAVRDFSGWIKSVDWAAIGGDIRAFGEDAAWVVDKIGGIGPAVVIVAGISLAPTIAAFVELGGAVMATAGKFVLFPVAELLASFATLIPTIGSLGEVWVALDIAMDANPIGAIVLAATTLIGVGYEIYQHWSQIKELWNGLPDGVKVAIEAVGAVFAPLITLPLEIWQHWSELEEKFKALWAGIGHIVERLSHPFSGPGAPLPGSGGADAGGFVDPASGMWIPNAAGALGTRAPLSALPGAAAAAGVGAPGAQGSTKITVDFKNMPQGTSVSTESRGNASAPDVDVGHAFAGM